MVLSVYCVLSIYQHSLLRGVSERFMAQYWYRYWLQLYVVYSAQL